MASSVNSADDAVFGRIIKSIFALVVLLLFSAAVFTYSPMDPPILYGGSSGEVYNLIGWAGAFISHLLLDEMYSVKVLALDTKRSFGTALKFTGPSKIHTFFLYFLIFCSAVGCICI